MQMRNWLMLIAGLASIWLASPCFSPGYAPFDINSLKWLPVLAGIAAVFSVVPVFVAINQLRSVSPVRLALLFLGSVLTLFVLEIAYWAVSYFVTADAPKQMLLRQIFGGVSSAIFFLVSLALLRRGHLIAGSRWSPTKYVRWITSVCGVIALFSLILLFVRNAIRASVFYYAIDCSIFGALLTGGVGSFAVALFIIGAPGKSPTK